MNRASEILIFEDDDNIHIDKYGEDVFAFKTDVEKGFKYLLSSRSHRGKRRECADMSALFHEMLEQEFPELIVMPHPGSSSSSSIVTHDTNYPESGRKRSRSSVSSSGNNHEDEMVVKSDKKVSRVSDSSSSSIAKKEEATVRTILPSKMKVLKLTSCYPPMYSHQVCLDELSPLTPLLLSTYIQADLKYIVNKIIKTEDADSFVYPVDAK